MHPVHNKLSNCKPYSFNWSSYTTVPSSFPPNKDFPASNVTGPAVQKSSLLSCWISLRSCCRASIEIVLKFGTAFTAVVVVAGDVEVVWDANAEQFSVHRTPMSLNDQLSVLEKKYYFLIEVGDRYADWTSLFTE